MTMNQNELRDFVIKLASEIGERNVRRPEKLAEAERWITAELRSAGLPPRRQTYVVEGVECANIESEIPGGAKKDEIVIVGGHYDSVRGSPGANDNGSGVAATLLLAKSFSQTKPSRTLRFVAFVNEEPPYFQTEAMGSVVYARDCQRRKEKVVAMISLETMGYFTDEPKSQKYPALLSMFYPKTGNFIGFVGNPSSKPLVEQARKLYAAAAPGVPCETAVFPPGLAQGVGWSDHWSFWQAGYPAMMITDTAPFRYPHYHLATDTPDKLDYERFFQVVVGVQRVIQGLAF